jgi:hypothetical protein
MDTLNLPLIRQVAEMLEPYRDDAEAFWDTLDGETDALTILDATLASMQDDEALAAAIKAQEADLKARRDRIAMRADAKRKTLALVLGAAGMRSAERPCGTVSVRPGNLSVRIVNEADLPSQLMRVKTTSEPDKAAIKAQLEAGVDVPGAALERGGDVVMVRVK